MDEAEDRRGGEAPPFFTGHLRRLPLPAKAGVLILVALSLFFAGRLGAANVPHVVPPEGKELEAAIAAYLVAPSPFATDSTIVGDYLVERFYILDLADGQRYIADFMKGQIEGVVVDDSGEGFPLMFLLDRRNMRRERELYARYVWAVAPPESPSLGLYLGMFTPEGMKDAFAVNYSGYLPAGAPLDAAARARRHDDIHSLLLRHSFREVTANPRLVSLDGVTYLLSSSEHFPLWGSEYGITRAVFVSELLIVDATSHKARSVYWDFFERPPRSIGRR